jgi:outer membrane immunogenic protein
MRRTTFGAAMGIVCIASIASAADFSIKAAAPVIALFSWTGFYAGMNVGGSWGRASTDLAPDSEVRMRECCHVMRTSEAVH